MECVHGSNEECNEDCKDEQGEKFDGRGKDDKFDEYYDNIEID